MKKIALAFGSSIACLFLLAACADTAVPSTSTTKTQTSTPTPQGQTNQNASLAITSTEETLNSENNVTLPTVTATTMQTEISADNQQNTEDKIAFDQAVAGSNESECNALKDPKAKILCQSKVSNSRSNEEVKGTTQQ